MENNMHYRNVTLSTRVSAAQKAEYVRIAKEYNISVSEWASTIIETFKNDYGTIGQPTPKEMKLQRALELKNKEIQKLKAQRDTSDEFAAQMQERSNKAIHDRDESNYALKVALAENDKLKRRINAIESLMAKQRPANKVDIRPEETIAFGLLTILSIVVFQVKF